VLNACDAFVLSSRNEGLGLAAVEAMACGVPVVATDVGGVREVLLDGRAGMLVSSAPTSSAPARDSAAADGLAQAIIDLAADEERRRTLAAGGRARATAFGLGRMVARYVELYRELAQ
jgi:glycosyltransferase involved in cell wall biosynthesis